MAERLDGKTALITGATDGIGFVTARELAARGARVILVGRNEQKGRACLDAINKITESADLSFVRADLSQMAEIVRFTGEIAQSEQSLDILVNNAGGIFASRMESADGIEMTFALNHINYFLTTLRLLDLLRAAPAARIVNVASRAHVGGRMDFDDLEFRKTYSARKAYQRSKLCNVLFTRALARRLEGSTITTNSLHPGFVRTAFGGAGNPFYFRWGVKALMMAYGISVEKGAETSIYLASSPDVADISGWYFVDCKDTAPSKAAMDDAAGERLWRLSEEMVRGSLA